MGPDGYVWWYVDALSDDGRRGLTIIAFVGSVFSPYYAWAGRRNPLDHCAVNVALYEPGAGRWAMTERAQGALERSPDHLKIGPSHLVWDGDTLAVEVDETCCPVPRKLQGRVRITPECTSDYRLALDARGEHSWWPIAPRCRVTVAFDRPSVRWEGAGYLDSNWGSTALEHSFAGWTWSRAPLGRGAAIFYDATRREGEPLSVALHVDPTGHVEPLEPPAMHPLPATRWRVARSARSENVPGVTRTLEDTPFYARSVVHQQLAGTPVEGIHESLSLDRFQSDWVKVLLPFRMPRSRSA